MAREPGVAAGVFPGAARTAVRWLARMNSRAVRTIEQRTEKREPRGWHFIRTSATADSENFTNELASDGSMALFFSRWRQIELAAFCVVSGQAKNRRPTHRNKRYPPTATNKMETVQARIAGT